MKRALALLLALVLFSGLPGMAEAALPTPKNGARDMILGETTAEYFYEATLYYIGPDGATLSPASRTLLIRRGETPPEVVLTALFNASGNPAQASIALGDTRVISCELASGIATVNLSIEARNVQSEQDLLLMYAAIAGTLCEIDGIEGVNILINGRKEGFLQLPEGVLTSVGNDVTAAWAQLQAEAERYHGVTGGAITRTAVVYFPSGDGARLVPEARGITFTREACASAILSLLSSTPESSACASPAFAEDSQPLAGEPTLTVSGGGERVLELNLRGEVLADAVEAGISPWQIFGATTLTLCSFVPELDALRVSVDGEPVTTATRDGDTLVFADGRMRRRDFSGFVGSAARVYLADAEGNLIVRDLAMSPGEAQSPRALLEALFSAETAEALGGYSPVPQSLTRTDILGVEIADNVATVNLSARFYSACQDLDKTRERTLVYAIVNTLCELTGVAGVRFLFEGESVETLTEYIYMKSTLLPNPGAVLTD